MRIQHNIAALNSYGNLVSNNNAVSKNLSKLSSGYKINSAADDAAGLAISEKMRAQITGLETATDNANDGISLTQTAEGALTEVHSMLNRMVELAEQSSNGTYQDAVDRENLQEEVTKLTEEIDRISESTNFNGINLLDGSLSATGAGGGMTGAQVVSYKAATDTTGGDDDAANLVAADFNLGDTVSVDGTDIQVDWTGLTTDERSALTKAWTAATGSPSLTDATKAAEIMQNTINDAIDKHNSDYGSSVSHITIKGSLDGSNNGQFTVTSGQKDANSDVSLTGLTDSVLSRTFGQANGTKSTLTGTQTVALIGTAADYNGKFTMSVGGEDIAIETGVGASTVNNAGDIVSALQAAIDTALTNYDAAKGLTGTDAFTGKVTVKLNAQGSLEFSNTTGEKIGFSDIDDGTVASTLGISNEGKNAMSGGLTLQIGDTSDDFNKMTVSVGDMSSNALGITGVDISNQSGATSAIDKIKKAINTVSSTRGNLGAVQNRLEHTINSLNASTENMTAAESRIRDVDMAEEMMSYTKNNILIQSSQAMLAQANQLPQGVLQLLQ